LNAFAHTVAHDLKGPLGLVKGYLMLMEENLGDEPDALMQKALQVTLQQSTKMNSIIEALLLLAGVRNMEVEVEALNMDQIIGEALSRLEQDIEMHDAEIVVPDTWPVASGYPLWIEEVWVNYISNAIKYGGIPPRLELGACIVPSNGSNDPAGGSKMIDFWVKDNGPGLSVKEKSRLFTPFTRLHSARAAGHGLGLSIVERIVSKLGGEVRVTSTGVAGDGSTFYFSLPMVRSMNEQERRLTERSPQMDLENTEADK
jgi:signal transduction histidine kinase